MYQYLCTEEKPRWITNYREVILFLHSFIFFTQHLLPFSLEKVNVKPPNVFFFKVTNNVDDNNLFRRQSTVFDSV